MKKAGVPCVPGSDGPLDDETTKRKTKRTLSALASQLSSRHLAARRSWYAVRSEAELTEAIAIFRAEAKACFNNDMVYMEKFLENPRHIEVQVLQMAKAMLST
ncbi:hypothetical protein O9929_22815 [Vibrio lentus]|nr:hypothetical protein [Vibrio lentus]